MSATLANLLVAEVGRPLAKALLSRWSASGAEAKLLRAQRLIDGGASVVSALKTALGSDFDRALIAVTGGAQRLLRYEAGGDSYVAIDISGPDDRAAAAALRRELNLNLDRVRTTAGSDRESAKVLAIGIFRRWMARYEERFGRNSPADQASLACMDHLLEKGRRPGAVAWTIGALALMCGALMLLVKAMMLFLVFGLGLWAVIKSFLFGVPFISIALLVILAVVGFSVGGAVLRSCARRNDLSEAAIEAYRMCDRHR